MVKPDPYLDERLALDPCINANSIGHAGRPAEYKNKHIFGLAKDFTGTFFGGFMIMALAATIAYFFGKNILQRAFGNPVFK